SIPRICLLPGFGDPPFEKADNEVVETPPFEPGVPGPGSVEAVDTVPLMTSLSIYEYRMKRDHGV
ncbi:MAG: hypothetical protein ACJ8AI_15350, partial [Rhodopila sp.]